MRATFLGIAFAGICCLGMADDGDLATGDEDGESGAALDLDEIEALSVCESEDSPAEVLVDCFIRGTRRDKLAAARWLYMALQPDGDQSTRTLEARDAMANTLISLMRGEPDDWISSELLRSIRWGVPDVARIVFREALEEPSINLKAEAVRYASFHRVPDTEAPLGKLWNARIPEWIRPDLMEALAEQGIVDHVGDFIRLTRSGDSLTRLAAIDALGSLGLAEAGPALLEAARRGTPRERAAAVRALGHLPVSDEGIDAMLVALDSTIDRVHAAAIVGLGRIDDPRASAALISVLERSSSWRDLDLSASGLEDSGDPDASRAIVGVLTRTDLEWSDVPADNILMALYNRDDPSIVPDLEAIATLHGGDFQEEAEKTVRYLSRNRVEGGSSRMYRTSCGAGSAPEPDDPRARRVSPPPPYETSRCWNAPGHIDPSDVRARLQAGDLVEVGDFFERPEGTWVEAFKYGRRCWVPLTELAPADTPPPPVDPARLPGFEFDLPREETESLAAQVLIEAGLMEILEPDSDAEVVAAALTVDPADPDQVALLEAVSTGRRGVLDRAIARFRRACCGPLP